MTITVYKEFAPVYTGYRALITWDSVLSASYTEDITGVSSFSFSVPWDLSNPMFAVPPPIDTNDRAEKLKVVLKGDYFQPNLPQVGLPLPPPIYPTEYEKWFIVTSISVSGGGESCVLSFECSDFSYVLNTYYYRYNDNLGIQISQFLHNMFEYLPVNLDATLPPDMFDLMLEIKENDTYRAVFLRVCEMGGLVFRVYKDTVYVRCSFPTDADLPRTITDGGLITCNFQNQFADFGSSKTFSLSRVNNIGESRRLIGEGGAAGDIYTRQRFCPGDQVLVNLPACNMPSGRRVLSVSYNPADLSAPWSYEIGVNTTDVYKQNALYLTQQQAWLDYLRS